ncbi:MAG: short-chain dehydrogenase [Rhodobacteraceae bacterium]|nr:short-chain dehydrogenase [Paracoccaceae bacterium]MAT01142.1 short-chain dehydrogenase [Paracoccaceae bacterium]MBL6855087.1 SDR family oxidoreductase [Paracoccaceae bacterium]MBV03566.1 short-chain dehydrogenase [Paracoccaceae bacterium]MDG1940128.1 SDR family oxidoreductase [Paracoccaceae bacterium]
MKTKTTLITGGGSGIGATLTKNLIAKGEVVVTLGLDLPNWKHDNLISYQADLTDTEQTNEAAQLISSSHKINNIVHNAGMILPNLLPKVKTDDILTLSHLHLAAPIALTQAILPNMINDKNGRIVFISSRASMGMPTRSAYAATKAGIHGLAKTWALELAENNITVNVIAPGPVLTQNFWDLVPKDSELQQEISDNIPVGRIGTTGDIANAVEFFLDEKASFVTGQVLYVCGGTSLKGLGT